MAPKAHSSLMMIIAILFAVCGSSVALLERCNVTMRLSKTIFGTTHGVHNYSVIDNSLKICSSNGSCCSRLLEMKLAAMSKEIRVGMVSRLQGNIKETFAITSRNFTEFFKSLIETSYQEVDKLYSRTYQHMYTNHKAVMRGLFTKLSEYMAGKEDIDLKQTVESWFSLLFQQVFMIAKPHVTFDAQYQHCLVESADELMPFGDLPRKTSLQVKKSFLASKVLQDALAVGAKVVEELLNMKANEQCANAFMKMTHCSICSRVEENWKPCFDYCMNVIKGCSAYPAVVNPSWNAYITALHNLALKIGGPFNMERVINPLGVEVSDGIMEFQRDTENITNHVVKKCGKLVPKQLLKKRSLDDDLSYPYKFESRERPKPTTAFGTNVHRLVKDLTTKLSSMSDHWVSLPRTVCSGGMAAPEGSSQKCWNGENVDGYSKPVVKDGIEEMFKNPEVALNKQQPHLTVPRQVIKLKEITQRILSATDGADSNRIDLEETSGEGSGGGSGVGSGSGDGSGSGAQTTRQPRTTIETTTEMDNNVELPATTRRVPFRTTMGNDIPDWNDGGNTIGDNGANLPGVQKSKDPNSARLLTSSYGYVTFMSILSLSFTLLLWK